MIVEQLIFHKKNQVIQNGDFKDIHNIFKNFSYKKIAFLGPIIYSEDVIENSSIYKQINTSNIHIREKTTFLELTDKPSLQIMQLATLNLFNKNINKLVYLPIFKNVIIEKKNTYIIAIYFIVLNLLNTKGKNGIIKVFI